MRTILPPPPPLLFADSNGEWRRVAITFIVTIPQMLIPHMFTCGYLGCRARDLTCIFYETLARISETDHLNTVQM